MSITVASLVALSPASPAATKVAGASASGDYSVRFLSDARVVDAGGTATYPFVLRKGSRFSGAVSFQLVGLPTGVSSRVVSLGRNQFQLQLSTASTLPSSSTVSTLRALSAGRVHQALLRITINGAPTPPPASVPPPTAPPATTPPAVPPPPSTAVDFRLSANALQNTAVTGQQVQYFINVDRSGGYRGNVTFSVSGLPTGATGGFGPNPTVAGTVLYLTPGTTTPSGTYILLVTARAGDTVRTTPLVLTVIAQSDFTLGVPPSVTMGAPQSGIFALDIRPNVAGTVVSLEVAGAPAETTVSFAQTAATGPTTLSIVTTANTAAGTYPLTITGRSGGFVHTATLLLTVQNTPGFGLTASPATVVAGHPGANASFIAVTPTGGFTGTVALGVAGLPSGVTATIGATAGGAYLTITVASGVAPGTYPFTFTGTSGNLVATIAITLQVV